LSEPDAEPEFDPELDPDFDAAPRPSSVRVVLRAVLVVGLLVVSAIVLRTVFDDLDLQEILDSLRSLDDAEILALAGMWILWIGAQGLQTSSLVPGLPVRRGVLAFIGPAAVASLVPGPSDLPFRHRMFTSWGRRSGEATAAVAAGGVFSIGIKLVLPIVAAVGLLLSDAPVEGALRTVVVVALVVGVVVASVAMILGSESLTLRVGRVLDPLWRLVLRTMRKSDRESLGVRLVAVRASASGTLRGRWLIASWGALLAATTRFFILLMALRFTGVPESELPWPEVFVVYALVQGLTIVPLTAGDAGVSEVAFIGLLTAATGSDQVNLITAAVILFRVLTWLVLIPVGLVALGIWKRTSRIAGDSG
jgi:putative heme transporter